MAKDDWEDVPLDSKEDDWEDVDHTPSMLEAGLRGAAQGASFGLEDELAGVGGVIGDALGRRGVDKVESPHSGVQARIDSIDDTSIGDTYRKSRDEERASNKAASDTHPGSYFTGSLAGGFANPLRAPGLKGALGFSAAQGLGSSDADLTHGDVKNAAIDTASGMGAGALGYGIGKAIPAGINAAKWAGKKSLTNLGPTSEAIEARLQGKAQDTAKSYPQLADKMGGTLKTLKEQIKTAGDAAAEKLTSDPSIPKAYAISALDSAADKLKLNGNLIGPADKNVAAFVDELKTDMNKLGDNISQKDLKTLIGKLDDNINWGDQTANKLNDVLKGVRNDFDKTLKFQNNDYKQAIIPVNVKMKILNNARKQFNFEHVPNEGLVPTNTTATKLQHSMAENKAETQKNLGLLARHTGDDYLEAAQDYRNARQFQKAPGAQGSKRTNIGIATGGGLGSLIAGPLGATIGGIGGAAAGGAMDAYGGKVAGKIIDSVLKAGNSKAFGKFEPAIRKAAEKGPQALAVLSSILETNPEFRKEMGLDQ